MTLETKLNLWEQAKKYDTLLQSLNRRLSKYPLWKRTFLYWHFSKLHNLRSYYIQMRQAAVFGALSIKTRRQA